MIGIIKFQNICHDFFFSDHDHFKCKFHICDKNNSMQNNKFSPSWKLISSKLYQNLKEKLLEN